MKNFLEEFEFNLTAEKVDECSNKAKEFLIGLSFSKKDAIRYSLSIEEILINYIDIMKEEESNVPVKFAIGKRFLSYCIIISVGGEKKNVYTNEDDSSELGNSWLRTIGVSPEYEYSQEQNIYTFKFRKKQKNPVISLGITVVAALIVNVLGSFIPEATRIGISDNVFVPLHEMFLNLLTCISGPLIFLSVAWGIYGIGDASTLKKIGGKIIKKYFIVLSLVITVLGVMAIPFFDFSFSNASSTSGGYKELIAMFQQFIPSNIVEPFYTKNTIQIIFIAIVFGIAMIILGKRMNVIARIVEQANSMVQFLIEILCKIMPAFIFIVLVEMFWSGMIDILPKIAKTFVLFVVGLVIYGVVLILYTSYKTSTNPLLLVKKGLPTLMIAITTASSAATFNTSLKMCTYKFGINENTTAFALPLGIIVYKAATGFSYLLIAFFLTEYYKINVSVPWFVIIIITVIVLSFATPPIPGGGASAYAVLLAQAGVPATAVAVALACDAILDFIATGMDQFAIPYILLNQSRKLGLVDENKLKRDW